MVKERAAADVTNHRQLTRVARHLGDKLEEGVDYLRRDVVNSEKAHILKAAESGGLSRSAHSREDDDFLRMVGHLQRL